MKQETINLLKALGERETRQHKSLIKTRDWIDKIKQTELLPELKKKYENTYWKYRNSYGGHRDDWFLYAHCTEVKGEHSFIFTTFETTSLGKSSFSTKDGGSHLFQTKITKGEYMRAAKFFIKRANKIIEGLVSG